MQKIWGMEIFDIQKHWADWRIFSKKKPVIILHDNTICVSLYENKIHTTSDPIAHDDCEFIDSIHTTAISLHKNVYFVNLI